MRNGCSLGAAVLAAALVVAAPQRAGARRGEISGLEGPMEQGIVPGAVGQPPHDPSKPFGHGQQAPLTAEYQAIFEANLADLAAGGEGNDVEPSSACRTACRG